MGQQFIPSPKDKEKVYLQLLEVKGIKGYMNFTAALSDVKTSFPHYYPRIIKINALAAEIMGVTTLGLNKYYFNWTNGIRALNRLSKDGYVIYVGEDEDSDDIWLGRYKYE